VVVVVEELTKFIGTGGQGPTPEDSGIVSTMLLLLLLIVVLGDFPPGTAISGAVPDPGSDRSFFSSRVIVSVANTVAVGDCGRGSDDSLVESLPDSRVISFVVVSRGSETGDSTGGGGSAEVELLSISWRTSFPVSAAGVGSSPFPSLLKVSRGGAAVAEGPFLVGAPPFPLLSFVGLGIRMSDSCSSLSTLLPV